VHTKFLLPSSFLGKLILPGLASFSVLVSQLSHPAATTPELPPVAVSSTFPAVSVQTEEDVEAVFADFEVPAGSQLPAYAFGNPAGCPTTAPSGSVDERLAAVQQQVGEALDLAATRQLYIWSGPLNMMVNVADDPFVFEFVVNQFQPPYTYKADEAATIFLNNGFVVWFRSYGDSFRLLAVPIMDGVYESIWGEYVHAYWQKGGIPNDINVKPVTKKLPCLWVMQQGFVTQQQLQETFNFDWHLPDYATEGRKFLASNCQEAYRVAREKIGYSDASTMCGPLAWQIVKDANSFPYRIGNWDSNAELFTQANPRWNGRPWVGFDPETYDLISTDQPMMGYDFANNGNLFTGDIVYSYSTLYANNEGRFDHIFLVTGINTDNGRSTITNMVQNNPAIDCFIREVTLYTPGDFHTGVINYEWNGNGYGSTGSTGFDVLRWKWIAYHLNGQPMQYTVRWGDTIETIAFDWKISPQSIMDANLLSGGVQLTPGQVITLPGPNSTS
jgi:hypothetical protein